MLKFTISIAAALLAIFTWTVAAETERSRDHLKVTCGSSIKLTHVETGYKLHSHEIKYGSGSGQQSVTAFPSADDSNSYFIVTSGYSPITQQASNSDCVRGQPIECGSIIRLLHVNTNHYLHSHLHQSPLSGNQEVSAFNEQNTGDNWTLHCLNKNRKYWMRDEEVRLSHVETDRFLHSSSQLVYPNVIRGQLEVSAVHSSKSKSRQTVWAAREGIYFSDNPIMS